MRCAAKRGFAVKDEVAFARPVYLDGVELVSVTYHARDFPMHTHDCFVVGTVMGGAERLDARGASHVIATGHVLHLHPYEPHANQSLGSAPLRYRVFYLSEAAIMPLLGEGECLSFDSPTVADTRLGGRLATLHRYLSDASTRRLEQESALAAVATALASPMRSERYRVSDNAAVKRTRDFIEDHLAQDFGLATLAEIAGLSVFRFAHVFKENTGLSPIAFRNQCRVDAARRLLLTPQPIADIAAELGFADQSHLTRHFQRIVGISPNRYRQQ